MRTNQIKKMEDVLIHNAELVERAEKYVTHGHYDPEKSERLRNIRYKIRKYHIPVQAEDVRYIYVGQHEVRVAMMSGKSVYYPKKRRKYPKIDRWTSERIHNWYTYNREKEKLTGKRCSSIFRNAGFTF